MVHRYNNNSNPVSSSRNFCNLSLSNMVMFLFNINITIIFALLLSTTSPSTTSTSLPEDLSDSISLLRVGQWTMESNGHGAGHCWKSYSSTCFSTCATAASMISGELCVVVSHSSMYSCRPRPSCLGNILFMWCTLTFSSYRIVEILTLGTITNIRDAV